MILMCKNKLRLIIITIRIVYPLINSTRNTKMKITHMFLETVMKIDSYTKYSINSPRRKFRGQISSIVLYDNAKRPKSEPNSQIACWKYWIKLSHKSKSNAKKGLWLQTPIHRYWSAWVNHMPGTYIKSYCKIVQSLKLDFLFQ